MLDKRPYADGAPGACARMRRRPGQLYRLSREATNGASVPFFASRPSSYPYITSQMSRAYSLIVRSEENQPTPAVLRMALLHQAAGVRQSASTSRWARV